MGTKDGVSAGRKPWRYYYVMAIPLGGSSGVTQDKLQEMTDMTAAIEQREEEYLHKVAAKNAAALEAAREDKQKTPMASHVAWVLRRLHVLSAALLLLMVALLYVWYMHDDGRDHVPPSLVRAVAIIVGVLLALNVAGWVAASRRSVNGARLLLLVGVALVVCLALGLDELNILRRTQSKLNEALTSSEDALTQDSMALILNGGTAPSLVQRFVLDSPSAFIWWLGEHCADSPTKLSYGSVVIDRREFFSPLWNEDAKSCVAATLGTCVRIDAIAEPIILVELVMLVLQVLFTGGFLAVWEPSAAGKTSKRRRQPSQLKPTGASYSQDTSSALSTALFTRLLVFGTALFGSSNAIASTDLLHFCSIADFHAVFTWMVVVCLLSGLSALLAALFVGCGWKQQLATVLLVLAVASEVYMLAEFVKLAARLIGPDISAEINQSQIRELREVYVKASSQTCSSIKRWISHVCVGMSNSEHPADFDSSCQHEFVALLVASFNFTDTYLAWSIGVKLVLLMQLIWPALRQTVATVLNYVCCISSRDEVSAGTVETSLQQSSPPVDYDEALDMYLTSLRVRDPARLATEREAFEKEWSIRTGRKLADVRTPRVVVAASDFGAIVRTLMLRRLTAICRLDLSLSVSSDGKMVLVHIFASDNLLIATLCEMETYRLQFADAVDPGRSFWHDKKEVNADQKVLDANTVKHKLKLLLAENAMHPKEAVWFSGESLARVSARVHALSRISRASRGIIRCRNPAPAFASYSPSIQRQFIYKKYPNRLEIPDTYRRSVVLRTVDCIRITRHIIDGEFDTNAAISSGLVASLHCLHSASRFDFNSRGALASAWVTFWRPTHLPGEFWPDEHPVLNLVGRVAPFRQPLQSVRDYFGEKIAFYFAWMAFYGKMTAIPAVAAAVVIMCRSRHSSVSALWIFFTSPHQSHADNGTVSEGFDKIGATLSLPELVLGLVVIVWSFIFAKLWERRSVWYQLQWGVTTADTVSNVDNLPFDLDRDIVQNPSICSELASLQRQLGAWVCVLVLGSANLLVVLSMLLSQGELVDIWGEKLAILSSCGCQAFLVQWNGACIPRVAHGLTRWEHPHYSSDHPAYRSSVVAKLFTLQLLNTFTGLMLLVMSSIGGLEILARFVVPLHPLYVSYNARIEGHIGIFIQMETLVLVLFVAQLGTRIILILSAVKRFNEIQSGEQSYGRKEREEETMLSTYPGGDKDYAQVVMQIGLVIMFSSACPLLPLLALIDCGVKLRQNALELCCIRQRPEPEGVQSREDNDDDIGLGLWAPWVLLMLKISVPTALALAAFTADNYIDISIERRVGWWLIGVLGIWLVAQLLWFLVPHESLQAEEARARNTFLVDRYFGHTDVNEQKASARGELHSIEKEAISLQDPPPSAKQSLRHYEERLELLQRLNVALRKREEIRAPYIVTDEVAVHATTAENLVQDAREGATEELYSTAARDAEAHMAPSVDDDAMQRMSDSSEEMIVGYFRPVRGAWPSPPEQPAEAVEEVKEDAPVNIMESIEAPAPQPPRRGSVFPGSLPLSEMKISLSGEDVITGSRIEIDGDSTGHPAPMRLSKLFKRIPASPPIVVPSSASDDAETPVAPPTSPFVPAESSFPQPDLDPGIFAPTQLSAEEASSPEGSHDDEMLEEKLEVPVSTTEEPRVSIAPPSLDADPPLRPFSPRLSFLRRKSQSPASTHNDNGSDRGSEAGASEQTLLRQLSPRLSFFTRKSKRSSSKVNDSEHSKSSVDGESASVPEPPAPRKLSKLFKRVQPPSTATPSLPPPPVDTAVFAVERTEVKDSAVNPASSVRDQFDFLSDAHSETTSLQSLLPIQRRLSRPPSPPPVYTKVDLSGLEAVREAANRRQFDFSADEQVWED